MKNSFAHAYSKHDNESNFMSIVSHELKGPLTNTLYVLNYLKNVLKHQKIDQYVLSLIEADISDVSKGIEAIDYLREFVNWDSDKNLEAQFLSEVNLHQYLKDQVSEIMTNYDKELRFEYHADYSVSKKIALPRIYIDKLLKIIIKNAIKYSNDRGLVIIDSSIKSQVCSITISDQGKGISEKVLKNFFNPLLANHQPHSFTRVTPAIKLSYVKKVLESLGGELRISSIVGKGTQVCMRFPCQNDFHTLDNELDAMSFSQNISSLDLKPLNVLIVEDNHLTTQLLMGMLEQLGQHADCAMDGVQAMYMAHQVNYDVIFMDISLPDMDGIELKRKLCFNENDKPIVIAVTSHDSDQDREFLSSQGFAAVLSKPINLEEVSSCLETVHRVLCECKQDLS